MIPFVSITVAAVVVTTGSTITNNIVLQNWKRKPVQVQVLLICVSIIAISLLPVINGIPLMSSTIFSSNRKNDYRTLFGKNSYATTRSSTTTTASSYVPLLNQYISKRNDTIHLETNNQTDNNIYVWEEEIPIVTKRRSNFEATISVDDAKEVEVDDNDEVTNNNNKKRSWISFGKYDTENNMDGMTTIQQESSSCLQTDSYLVQPHPLRTDEWCVSIQWRKLLLSAFLPLSSNSNSMLLQSMLFTNKKWYIQFNENGFARFVVGSTTSNNNNDNDTINSQSKTKINTNIDTNDSNENYIAIGPWEILPCGKVMWILPIYKQQVQQQQQQQQETKSNNNKIAQLKSSSSITTTTTDSSFDSTILLDSLPRLVFVADIHPNLFGQQPKMIRGYILLDNIQKKSNNNIFSMSSSWIRPIVAAFYANGIGIDSADLSYQSRK